jgi:hypothetical protein
VGTEFLDICDLFDKLLGNQDRRVAQRRLADILGRLDLEPLFNTWQSETEIARAVDGSKPVPVVQDVSQILASILKVSRSSIPGLIARLPTARKANKSPDPFSVWAISQPIVTVQHLTRFSTSLMGRCGSLSLGLCVGLTPGRRLDPPRSPCPGW